MNREEILIGEINLDDFSITINERPYFHRIKPLKIGTFLLKNCMPKIAVAIRDGKPVPYRNIV